MAYIPEAREILDMNLTIHMSAFISSLEQLTFRETIDVITAKPSHYLKAYLIWS